MLHKGQRLGEFEILEPLGEGGMGEVYKAWQTSLRRTVAIKTPRPDLAANPDYIARFHREAIAAAGLSHQNLVQVFSAGEDDGLHWFAMEYVEGESAKRRLQRDAWIEPPEALDIAIDVAKGLQYAWRQAKLIHRDIKPGNILLPRDGEVKLGDLGLAKSVGQEQDPGAPMGTPHYMSPEQFRNMKDVDFRADIYSLGCTLYHLLCGKPPYTGSDGAIMEKHLSAPVPKLSSIRPDCPAELAAAVGKMMRKQPAERPQNYREVIAALELAQEVLSGASSRSFTVEERYRVSQPLGKTDIGFVYHAEDLTQGCEVRLCYLYDEMVHNSAARTALEQEVERLKKVGHANLLRVLAFETFGDATILATEWTNGFSLLELLRARRKLRADEAIRLLRQVAEGVDHAVEYKLTGSQFGLEQMLLDFAESFKKETLLREAVSQWPVWTLKIHLLGWNQDLRTWETLVGDRTLVGGGVVGTLEGAGAPAGPVRALASVIYDLLGGVVSVDGHGGAALVESQYTPLTALTETGNEVLKRALNPANSFTTAQKFYEALVQSEAARGGSGPDAIVVTQQSVAEIPQVGTSRRDVHGQDLGHPGGAPLPASPQSKWPLYAGLGAGLLAVTAGAFFLFQPKDQKPTKATKDAPFVNTLGMKFVPVPGTQVLFSIWDTRVRDYAAYARVNKVDGGEWATREVAGVPVSREPEYPVVGVSWEDAQAFCQWLTDEERAVGKLPKEMNYRLPTDEEWSWAVGLPPEVGATPAEKSGKNDVDFAWGKEYPPTKKIGNYGDETFHAKFPKDFTDKTKDQPWIEGYDDGYATTSPVGSFPANGYGLYDMGGNVWQWCEDCYDKDRSVRVLRGAAWFDYDRRSLLSSYRSPYAPGLRYFSPGVGFRCVVAPADVTLGLLPITSEDQSNENSIKHFTLRIPIKKRPGARIDVKDLVLRIPLFDIVDGQNVVLTSANVNFRWATPPADWVDSDTEELVAEYQLSKPEARAAKKENRKYFGYIVRIYYKQQLQAATAAPRRLSRLYPPPPTLPIENEK